MRAGSRYIRPRATPLPRTGEVTMPRSGSHLVGRLPRRLVLVLALVVVAWVPLAGPLSPQAAARTPTTKATAKPAPAGPSGVVKGHLIAFNDFHGNLDPPVGSSGLVNGVPAGGVEYLAHYVKQLRS